jgi:hypothetical protein
MDRACKSFLEIRLSVVQLLLDVPVLRSIELDREVPQILTQVKGLGNSRAPP